jgi:hypothetical protein
VADQRVLVEGVIGRPDHGDGVGSGFGCVFREAHRVGSRLRAAVHRDLQPAMRGLEKQPRDAAPLLNREQDPLAGRPQRQDPVEPTGGQEVGVRRERVLVDGVAPVAKRRQRGRENASEHGSTLSS